MKQVIPSVWAKALSPAKKTKAFKSRPLVAFYKAPLTVKLIIFVSTHLRLTYLEDSSLDRLYFCVGRTNISRDHSNVYRFILAAT